MPAAAAAKEASDASFACLGGDILTGLDGGLLDCQLLSAALRLEVRAVEVVAGTERRWPQSHSAQLQLAVAAGEGATQSSVTVFLKKVIATNLPAKPLRALHRDLASNRREARFYREFAPELAARGVRLLGALLVEEKLDGVDAAAELVGGDEEAAERLLRSGGVLLLLESVGPRHTQLSPLSADRAACALRTLARLHAAAWEDRTLLARAAQRLGADGGYWRVHQRGADEMQKMREVWPRYLQEFAAEAPELLARPEMVRLAERLGRLAPWVAAQMAVRDEDPFATLIHGDYKAMNVFLPDSGDGEALPIDFQWVGVGLGMSDVAMHLSHSVAAGALREGGEEALVGCYREALVKDLTPAAAERYTPAVAWRHYQLGVLDWARMVLSVFFAGASPQLFASRAANPNVGLVYRDVQASLDFVARVDRCLRAFEQERDAAASREDGQRSGGGGRWRSRSPPRR